jgi:hypothetical protein
MAGAEQRQLGYVFKLKQSANAKRLIGRLMGKEWWVEAGQGWQGLADELQLQGWSVARRAVVLRWPLRAEAVEKKKKGGKQLVLDLPEVDWSGVRYEYAVLVTSLRDEVRAIAQHYRDRGDAENNFDELRTHCGWAGFNAGPEALPTDGEHHGIDLQLVADLHAVGDSGQACRDGDRAAAGVARDCAAHPGQQPDDGGGDEPACPSPANGGRAEPGELILKRIRTTAEQLSQRDRGRLIRSAAFQYFLRGRIRGSTVRLAEATG